MSGPARAGDLPLPRADGPSVLFVSPLPPPAGGIATWTEIVVRRGLPAPWGIQVINTARTGPSGSFARGGTASEVRRAASVIGAAARAAAMGRAPAVVHLNVAPLNLGFFRDAIAGGLLGVQGTPVILHHHGEVAEIERQVPAWQRALFGRVVRRAAANIVMTPASDEAMRKLCAGSSSQVVKLPNFYDETRAVVPRAADPVPVVLFVGGLTLAKGVDILCEVAKRVPEADFVLLGAHYPETDAVLGAAPRNVRALGEVAPAEVSRWLARAALLLFPSAHEGFPYAVLEAMVAGLPVVATPAGAIADMIDEAHGGHCVDRNDREAIAQRVRELVASPERRGAMGAHNREKARSRYAFDVVSRSLLDLYASCAKGHGQHDLP